MTGTSICSFETKSTAAEMKSSSNSTSREDENISLPENVKALLMDGGGGADGSGGDARDPSDCHVASAVEEKQAYDYKDSSAILTDETVRRNILKSVSAAVKEWDVAEENRRRNKTSQGSNLNTTAAQVSSSGPGKVGIREKLQYSLFSSSRHCKERVATSTRTQDTPQVEKPESRDRPRQAVSADESEYVRIPQPHDDAYSTQPIRRSREPEEELSAVLQKYQHPRKSSKNVWAKEQAQATTNLFLRMSRQVRLGRRGSLPNPHRCNRIKLHVYDLIPAETVMQLPWGCFIPIGRCFDVVNSSLHSMGTGAYHVGVEVNGVEYSYGACDIPGHTGVFSCVPKRSPGYQYRTTIDFGERTLVKKTWVDINTGEVDEVDRHSPTYTAVERCVDGREVIKQMATEYMGIDYDLLRKNCVTFASDAAVRLGVKEEEIPSWFRNLCESGALTQDVALQTVEPIQSIFSACEDYGDLAEKTLEDGFEVITKVDGHGLQKVVRVMDSVESKQFYGCSDCPYMGVRRTLSWTY